jgi:hypothetical protein
MNLKPAFSKRSRRGLFRVMAVIGALAVMAGGAVAVTGGPARAQTVPSGGPFTLTYSGGDVVATYDDAGADPAVVSNIASTAWPESVGLPANPSLSALFQATYQEYSSIAQQYSGAAAAQFTDPPTFSGGSISVASDGDEGSTVVFDIPAADVQTNSLPAWASAILGALAGAAAALIVGGVCTGVFGAPLGCESPAGDLPARHGRFVDHPGPVVDRRHDAGHPGRVRATACDRKWITTPRVTQDLYLKYDAHPATCSSCADQ